ncbi:TonB-dependent receptor plug domain-containing protein [Tenacibaculum sp. IB213877]|uniref:TonB-dependent receptor plug domain-containing protein n=1 Tax=Tenacibaculum sp. IB213877 TaxID=3097351 RepID=UPI002A5A5D79|nr:TonB-dependent receptor [Tenacibaculum sp. IB213877]MDY0779661.1 TonB-dependent receptor [Tenacibaculum sp. IB213877]
MKKQFVIVSALACLFATAKISAQEAEKQEELDEIVISATKFNLKKENTAKVIHKITQEDLKNNAGKSVIDVINNVVGVEIKGVNTNSTEPRSTYIRGGRSRQVLVLIDGIPVSDPSGINQEYDLRLLSLNQIESIEVLKGASSTLYGSGAATGVINIILKKASEDKISGGYEASFGTNNDSETSSNVFSDLNQNANFSGTLNRVKFLASFGLISKDGMSSAKSNTNTKFENDKYYSENGLLKLGYDFSDNFSIETFMNYDSFDYDFDADIYTDEKLNDGNQNQLRIGVKPRFTYENGELYVLASYNDIKRKVNQFNSYGGSINTSVYQGQSYNIDAVNKFNLTNINLQLITGVNYQKHDNNTTTPYGNIDNKLANFNTIDPYVSAVYISDFGLNVNLGGRLNNHSEYGSNFVYDFNSSYNFLNIENTNLKVLASYSSAFITPSTYQLFSTYGNLDLEPETSETIETGFELGYKNIIELEAVYFNRKEEEAIIYQNLPDFPYGIYQNTDETIKVNGIEANLRVKPIDQIRLNVGYTYTDKEVDVDYIPKHKFIASLESNPFKNAFVSLVYKNVGERFAPYYDSTVFATVEATLPKYNLLDLNANYKLLNEKVTLFGSVTNLFNEDYEDVLGYSTRGRNYKLGIRLQF